MMPRGFFTIDAGAAEALRAGNSLLPAGIMGVSGTFGRGDPVEILDDAGAHVGQGLTRYTSAEAAVLKGHKTAEIQGLLGYAGRAALIHRDDMAL
jgi:glutamate 5-kinase